MKQINIAKELPVRTQFLIITILGEYVSQRGGTIWTSTLLYLMGLLDISERAVRSTLSRMSRKGWVVSQKHGRRSKYIITPRGRDLLEQGSQRIFEPIFTDWDGKWHLVVYSLPEGKRRIRHALRQNLTWLGFGRLAPGTWISPHDRRPELKAVFRGLNVEPYVDLFAGRYLGPTSSEELTIRCWDLEGLAAQYTDFIERFEPEYQQFLRQEEAKEPFDPEKVFVQRFWLTHEYQSFPLKDPNLPTNLLPEDWIGFTARELFENYHTSLGHYATEFINEVMQAEKSPLTLSMPTKV